MAQTIDADYATATAAALKLIEADIAAKAGFYSHLIPAGAPAALAAQLGKGIVDALRAANG